MFYFTTNHFQLVYISKKGVLTRQKMCQKKAARGEISKNYLYIAPDLCTISKLTDNYKQKIITNQLLNNYL